MKVMVATAVLTLLILVGWDQPYEPQVAALRTKVDTATSQWLNQQFNELLVKLRAQQTQNLATAPVPTPAPEPQPGPTPVDSIPVPPAPSAPSAPSAPPSSGRKDDSWMWGKSSLDNQRQIGVDRAGVHTSEPLLQNNP